jgi:hypothetical protein
MIRARYRIVATPLSGGYKIADEHMGGAFCSLPDKAGKLIELRFRTGRAARDWLAACNKLEEM